MNKEKLIEELEKITELDHDKCVIVNDILENHFLIGKKNKEKIISDVEDQLKVTKEESEKIYESAMSILANGIGEKLKHPFGNQNNNK